MLDPGSVYLILIFIAMIVMVATTIAERKKLSDSRRNQNRLETPAGYQYPREDREWQDDTEWEEQRRLERLRRDAEIAELRLQQEQELNKRKSHVQTLFDENPTMDSFLQQVAGNAHRKLQATDNAELVDIIARKLSEEQISVLQIALRQTDIQMDLREGQDRSPVPYPASDMEPSFGGMDHMLDITLEDQLLPDELYYHRLAHNELTVMQGYEKQGSRKRIVILLDVSGSMENMMANEYQKHTWARGVVISLLFDAVEGNAVYIFRAFDGEPHRRQQVNTPEEATRLIGTLLETGLSNGGTNIWNAVHKAVEDIRGQKADDIPISDILLISDGEDNSMDDTKKVEKLLGADIRLHVVMIGGDSKPLRKVATTYVTF